MQKKIPLPPPGPACEAERQHINISTWCICYSKSCCENFVFSWILCMVFAFSISMLSYHYDNYWNYDLRCDLLKHHKSLMAKKAAGEGLTGRLMFFQVLAYTSISSGRVTWRPKPVSWSLFSEMPLGISQELSHPGWYALSPLSLCVRCRATNKLQSWLTTSIRSTQD